MLKKYFTPKIWVEVEGFKIMSKFITCIAVTAEGATRFL